MKKALHFIIALLAFVGLANAQVVADFETGDFSQLNPYSFTNDATYPWTVENVIMSGSNYLIQSGNAGNNGTTSAFSISVNFGEPGYISFDAKCMGEGDLGSLYDVCQFSIDGSVQLQHGEDISGWNTYTYNVTAGTHEFEWAYIKDGSYSMEGDCFQLDNITFGPGTGCAAPFGLIVQSAENYAELSWEGCSDTYTLRYKNGTGAWNTVPGITDRFYTLENLTTGDYTVEVQSDCEPGNWATGTFMIHVPASTADWYGYVYNAYSLDYEDKIDCFNMQDLTTVTVASEAFPSYVYGATFVKGEMWFCMYNDEISDYSLYKAPIDIYSKTVGTPEVVVEYCGLYVMAYNPVNGLLYYVDYNDGHLKSINPEAIGPVTDYGEISNDVYAFAINKDGEAYGNFYDGSDYLFCSVNLTNASLTVIDAEYGPYEGFAFDLVTNELFGVYGSSLYYIDPQNPEPYYCGQIGGDEYVSFDYGFFMVYDWDAVSETEVERVNVYPNPAQGQVTVEGTGLMVVSNLLGQEVLRQQIDGKATVELPKGIYLVRVNNAMSKVVVE